MRLVTFLLLPFGVARTIAYSIPGGYERVIIYYMYSIDCQMNGGTTKKIAPSCAKTQNTGGVPCTLDQLLRYISANPSQLPSGSAPATHYPALPNMDETAQALARMDADDKNFAGSVNTGRALPGSNSDFSKFLAQLGSIALDIASKDPDNAKKLKQGFMAIRNSRRAAMLTTFTVANPDIKVVSNSIPLYEDAPDHLNVNVMDPGATVEKNDALTMKELGKLWESNTEGGHAKNVKELKFVVETFEDVCPRDPGN